MAVKQVGDAVEDFDQWMDARRSLLTSSEVFSWIGKTPTWWQDDRASVLAGKVEHAPKKEFPMETEVSIAHGSFDEVNIMRKFGHAVGCNVLPHNGLFVNDRWPAIGASIDGYGRPWDYDLFHEPDTPEPETHPEFSQDRTLFPYLRDYIDKTGDTFLLEIKKSLSVKWKKEIPEYYVTQVKTQMAVLEIDYAIITAETMHKGNEQKWRNYWDMRAYVVERDVKWERQMDKMNREFFALTDR